MLDARAHRFSVGPAPVDAAHHGQGHEAAVLIVASHGLRFAEAIPG
jgi:hypothetical protein